MLKKLISNLFKFISGLGIFLILSQPVFAKTYHLNIARNQVNLTGKPVSKITANGTLPAPTLYFEEGENVVINVTNHLDEDTSIHWHGFLLPAQMDGVPGINGFDGIKPGETFTYHFKIRQAGTYWYHSHSNAQEQDGNYGAIVITPKKPDPIKVDADYVVLLSDFSEEKASQIMANLKSDSDYYSKARPTIGDFFSNIKKLGFKAAWNNLSDWGQMRMLPTDLSDVTGYTFLINGKTPSQNWTALFKAGQKVKLRFINASAMTFYDVRIPNLKMLVVAADGQNIEPITIDEFRLGNAETYDVIVQPQDQTYSIIAEAMDRSGFALGTLATKIGAKNAEPKHRQRATLTMADMGMDGESGWENAGTPAGHKALNYTDLRYLGIQKDRREPEQEIAVVLGGNMTRYIWTMNGKPYDGKSPITLKYNQRVRLKFTNQTMMAHPMHLHGMFLQLENGQPINKLPNKHTIIIPPGKSVSALLTANEEGQWVFHCHLLYHMMSGMMSDLVVEKVDKL
ncbi:MAG: multicopper oxidase domain-containing protein [Pseudomonadota bacterium]